MHKAKVALIAATLILVIGGIGFWYWSQNSDSVAEKTSPTAVTEVSAPGAEVLETPAAAEAKDGLGAEAFNKTNNPLSNELPETNPFRVDTNPFK